MYPKWTFANIIDNTLMRHKILLIILHEIHALSSHMQAPSVEKTDSRTRYNLKNIINV